MKIIIMPLANDEVCVCGRCKRENRTASYTAMGTAVRRTWAAEKIEGIKTYYIYGRRAGIEFPTEFRDVVEDSCIYPEGFEIPKNEIGSTNVRRKRLPFAIDDCIYSDTPEGRENLYYKTIDGFEWLLENEEFDYVLRTTVGTYIDLHLLKQMVEKIGIKDNIYAGSKGVYSNSHNANQPPVIEYGSGSAFLISRNLVELLVKAERENTIDLVRGHHKIKCIGDDPTIGKFIAYDLGVELITWNKAEFTSVSQIGSNAINQLQCYFCHQINPELMYAVHRAKGLTIKDDVSSLLKGRHF